jgi:biopolymer transport protein ExbD
MKFASQVCVIGSILICVASAQEPRTPALQRGVSVEMPVATHAVEMRAADEPNATVVAITADGRVFVGTDATDAAALSKLSAQTVYVKADARVPYQKVLTVMDALRGKSVVLLTAAPNNIEKTRIVPPYGMKVTFSR